MPLSEKAQQDGDVNSISMQIPEFLFPASVNPSFAGWIYGHRSLDEALL